MNGFKKILLTSFLLIPQLAHAGGWTSGGGELIRDAHNPWFLSNTKDVKYCIKINEKDFGQSKEFVRLQIFKAIQFWKMQLGELTYRPYSQIEFSFNLGTQNFYEVTCDRSPDIKFQFAELDKEQKERLGDLSKTIAVSVRTDYDLKNLKGKGFVFFNKDEQFPNRPWTRTEGSRVLMVMIHELGHMFGIRHSEDVWMMKEDFPEELIESKNNQWVDQMSLGFGQGDNYKEAHLFSYHNQGVYFTTCQSSAVPFPKPINISLKQQSTYRDFFGQSKEDNCSGFFLDEKTFKFRSGKDTTNIIGEAQLERQNPNSGFGIFKVLNIINFWLPPEQKVFKIAEYYNSTRLQIGQFFPKQFFKGTYKSVDGKISRPIILEVSNSGNINKITGYMNGEIYIDLQSGF